MKVLYLDTETTGLDIERHEVWEFAAVVSDTESLKESNEVHLVWEPTWLENADPGAIKVNRYYERTAGMLFFEGDSTEYGLECDPSGETLSDPAEVAKYIAWLCEDAIFIGNNPAFDEMFLTKFCREQSQVLAAFHRKINVVDLALGALTGERDFLRIHGDDQARLLEIKAALKLPHSSTLALNTAGCPKNENVHTALGDARHVRAAFTYLWGTE